MKPLITIDIADALLEKYYEGTTTAHEEALLQQFLTQENLPHRFEADAAIFGYIKMEQRDLVEKESTAKTFMPFPVEKHIFLSFKTIVAAAVCLAFVFIPLRMYQLQNKHVAYVNGVRSTDKEAVRELAWNSIESLGMEENVMEDALHVFSNDLPN